MNKYSAKPFVQLLIDKTQSMKFLKNIQKVNNEPALVTRVGGKLFTLFQIIIIITPHKKKKYKQIQCKTIFTIIDCKTQSMKFLSSVDGMALTI